MDKFLSVKQVIAIVATVFTIGVAWALWGKTMYEFPRVWAQEKQEVEQKITNVQAEQAKYAAEERVQERTQTQLIRDMMALNVWERCYAMYDSEPRCAQQQDSLRLVWRSMDAAAELELERRYIEIDEAVTRDTAQ